MKITMEDAANTMVISVASGKGGTGKTTVAVNLALSISENEKVEFLDCDVEAPNAHFFLKPSIHSTEPAEVLMPVVNENLCDYCGRCQEVCSFHAIAVIKDHVLTFPELCHGCGGCARFCPEEAIAETGRTIGVLERGSAGEIEFAHGKLNPGEAMASPLVKAVKKLILPDRTVILDAPPGTSCSTVETVRGSDVCVLVTEPTPFGLHDLRLAVKMVGTLGIPAGVVINRSDLGDEELERYCNEKGLPVLLKIPWDRRLAELYAVGEAIASNNTLWKSRFSGLFLKIKRLGAGS